MLRLLVIGFCMLFASSVAEAQTPIQTARSEFENGLSLLDQGRHAEAVQAFERSIAAVETAPALFNLGLARRGAGQFLEAIDAFSRAAGHPDADPDRRAAAEQAIAEVRQSLATVNVEIVGEANRLTVDGTAHNVQPNVVLVLNPGAHHIVAQREGYAPAETRLTCAAGSQHNVRLDVTIEQLDISYTISATPSDAAITVDGELVGSGRVVVSLRPGAHHVRIEADGRRTIETEIDAAQDQPNVTEFELRRESVARKWWLWTTVGVVVAGTVTTAVILTRPIGIDTGNTGVEFAALRSR